MRPSEALERHRADIRRIVEANRARNPRVFGSVLHGDDDEDSDLDILVDAQQGASLFDLVRIKSALEDLMRIRVDVRTPEELHERFRDRVVGEAEAV
jgi:predicted nucleotidyltransferase